MASLMSFTTRAYQQMFYSRRPHTHIILYSKANARLLIRRHVKDFSLRASVSTNIFSSEASHLIHGLDVYQVMADDGHPLAVYGIGNGNEDNTSTKKHRHPILLLHGRTWSSVPVYHLLGGDNRIRYKQSHSRSLMELLFTAGLQPFSMDFRGFGGTTCDSSGVVVPNRCVKDVECVLEFISTKMIHERGEAINGDDNKSKHDKKSIAQLPSLLGWSQGALIAQLTAQKSPHLMSKLVLYGSIYDPFVRYPRTPLYLNITNDERSSEPPRKNTFNDAIEDFTVEGSIPPEPARLFAETALMTDPIKARWTQLCQFNNLDPARIHIPTLVIAGDQDPYAPLRIQGELFTNLGRGADRTWSIIADADHAIHLLDGARERFVHVVKHFIENNNNATRHSDPSAKSC